MEEILPADWLEETIRYENRKMFVAKQNGEIAGLVLISINKSPVDPPFIAKKWVCIEELAVLQAERGKGIGSKLMQHVENYSRLCK